MNNHAIGAAIGAALGPLTSSSRETGTRPHRPRAVRAELLAETVWGKYHDPIIDASGHRFGINRDRSTSELRPAARVFAAPSARGETP